MPSEPSQRRARTFRRRAWIAFAVAALASPATLVTFACNQAAGLDDFKEVACEKAPCDAAVDVVVDVRPDTPDASDADLIEAAPVPDTGPVVEHRQWAHWKMPNPDAGPPLLPNLAAYDGSAATPAGQPPFIVDDVTHLEWMAAPAQGVQITTIGEALNYCSKFLNQGWRLPTRIELVSLIDVTKASGPALHDVFSTAPAIAYGFGEASRFWTLSHVAGASNAFWIVDFSTSIVSAGKGNTVRCVRRGPDK